MFRSFVCIRARASVFLLSQWLTTGAYELVTQAARQSDAHLLKLSLTLTLPPSLPTYLPTYLPTSTSISLSLSRTPTYLPTYLPTYRE